MVHLARVTSHHSAQSDPELSIQEIVTDLYWPFGKLEGIDRDDFREAAYEIFFTACRSSPGFGGRNAITYYNPSDNNNNNHLDHHKDAPPANGAGGCMGSTTTSTLGGGGGFGGPVKPYGGVGMAVTSRVKRTLGLKMLGKSPSRRSSSGGGGGGGSFSPSSPNSLTRAASYSHTTSSPSSGSGPRLSAFATVPARPRRPLTSAEIMRQQMRVTEQSDNRLRKTLMRTLVGQMGRRAETIILPLELLRHLKPSEFNDPHEYHLWQKRQLKILEAGLLLHPAIPVEKSNEFARRFREIIQASELRPIDTGKSSETMKSLCNSVVSLSWRSSDGSPTDVCHWADGYPVNVHIYIALLYSIFDTKDETLVLDEVDELLELMKKTWSTLGINRSIHNLCLTWVFFEHYILTGQVEVDLLGASLAMLAEVANDAKKVDREPLYLKMLASVLVSMKRWLEKRMVDYHRYFGRGTVGLMENVLPIMFSVMKILEEDVPGYVAASQEKDDLSGEFAGNRVDLYVRSSLKNAFATMLKEKNINGTVVEMEEASEVLIKLADEVEKLASNEKEVFSCVLKKWHPIAAGVGAVTLHTCYGTLLNQYLSAASTLTNETISVLNRVGKLEKFLVNMVVEDSDECEDGGKAIVREMVPFEVESIILNRMKQWIQEILKKGKEFLNRAKETETWNPKSKNEPYAHSAVDLLKFIKESVENFLETPVNISEYLVQDFASGLEHLFRDYITFVASCGSKQSYIPTLPPLTRCSRDSKISMLWKRAACSLRSEDPAGQSNPDANHPRPSTSRGTQRLYIRLNTLHYLSFQLHSLDKTMSLSPRVVSSSPHTRHHHHRATSSKHLGTSYSYFGHSRSAIQVATQYVAEVSAYRLIFLDSSCVFYGSLYVGDVTNTRIKPAIRILKQNLTLLCVIVTERAQPIALKEVMKASFEAYLMVLLAGGSPRIFSRSDHQMIEEDFDALKRVFCTCGEGLILEDDVDREADIVEGVVALMGQSTEQLVEDFSILACEASGIGVIGGAGQKLPMPPTTGRWNRTDPNTILRVLCYRNDRAANLFLKRTFQLAKRKG